MNDAMITQPLSDYTTIVIDEKARAIEIQTKMLQY